MQKVKITSTAVFIRLEANDAICKRRTNSHTVLLVTTTTALPSSKQVRANHPPMPRITIYPLATTRSQCRRITNSVDEKPALLSENSCALRCSVGTSEINFKICQKRGRIHPLSRTLATCNGMGRGEQLKSNIFNFFEAWEAELTRSLPQDQRELIESAR